MFITCGTQTAPEIDVESPKILKPSLLDSSTERITLNSGDEPIINHQQLITQNEPDQIIEKSSEPVNIHHVDVQSSLEGKESIETIETVKTSISTQLSNDRIETVDESVNERPSVTTTPEIEEAKVVEEKDETQVFEQEDLFASTEELTITTDVTMPVPITSKFGWEEYMILPGDYLFKIAKKEYGDWKRWRDIYEWNRKQIGDNPNLIFPYHFLDMKKPVDEVKQSKPTFTQYTVKEGDNLWTIAGKTYGDEKSWIIVYWDNEDVLETNDGILFPGMIIQLREKLDPNS